MRLTQLWLTDFRNYHSAEFAPHPDGLTVIGGDNGQGKTNLLEAIGWLATLESFRGAPPDALVRDGASSAVVRASAERDGRQLLLEAQLVPGGRTTVQVNRQTLRRSRDLLGALRTSVFSPDDLVLVKGGPGERRRYIDDLLVSCHPRWDRVRSDVDRILRQRATLLKQAGGRLTPDVALTLDVWDEKLHSSGSELAEGRAELVARLHPAVAQAYTKVAGGGGPAGGGPATGGPASGGAAMSYVASWRSSHGGGLAEALAAARNDDVRRGVSTVGPHRDDVALTIDGLPARTHASQGEQRSLALALRLGGHDVVTESAGASPVLLLDDVFSELDPTRSAALLTHLPPGQALLTTAGVVPAGAQVARAVRVRGGEVVVE